VAKLLLVLATVADGALAALMVGVSGFMFGGVSKACMPESWSCGDRLSGGPDRRICSKQAR